MRPVPTTERRRVEILDVLRGFALLGIFLAHVPGFSGWDSLPTEDRLGSAKELDSTLQFMRILLVNSKFFSLFSFLFGFGFAIQMASAKRGGDAFGARFRRRQLGLLVIGLIHSLFWHGDILLKYAVLGLLLIPTTRWSTQNLFRFAVACLLARGLWGFLPWLTLGWMGTIASGTLASTGVDLDVGESVRQTQAGYYSGDFGSMLSANFSFLKLKWLYVLYEGKLISILGFFALGAAFGRWRVHERTLELRPVLWRVFWIGGTFGLLGNFVFAMSRESVPVFPPSGLRVAEGVLMSLAIPAQALAMASAITLAWDRGRPRWLAWLAPPGRMALTTYLSQTLIGIGLFYGVGLGWRGTFSLADCFGFAVTVFVLQAIAARFWLTGFAFGPIEWLWRCATYGRWLPLRRSG